MSSYHSNDWNEIKSTIYIQYSRRRIYRRRIYRSLTDISKFSRETDFHRSKTALYIEVLKLEQRRIYRSFFIKHSKFSTLKEEKLLSISKFRIMSTDKSKFFDRTLYCMFTKFTCFQTITVFFGL